MVKNHSLAAFVARLSGCSLLQCLPGSRRHNRKNRRYDYRRSNERSPGRGQCHHRRTTTGCVVERRWRYFILNIPPGTYSLRASAVGYTPVVVNAVKVTADQTTRIDFTLVSQSVELNDVVVTASRPIVQKDLTSTVSSVTSDQIAKLPLEDVGSVVNLQAGVVEGHFRGGRSNEVKYLVDGVPVTDVFSGGFSLQPEVNSIEEIQVLSGTFNAEYGEALSGVVNQITKIAGENYTGEISAYTGDYVTSYRAVHQHQPCLSRDLVQFPGEREWTHPGARQSHEFLRVRALLL